MNRDVLFMTFAGVMLGTIVIISELFLRGMYYSNRYGGRSSSKGGDQIKIVIIVVAVLFAILAPLFARILYFAISRKREYLADASAARLTRYPEGLASALERISRADLHPKKASKVIAPMYIVNPLANKRAAVSAFSTHPPIKERVAILRDMTGGANFLAYQNAYSSLKGKSAMIIPPSGLKDTEEIAIRGSSEERRKEKSSKKTMREVGDLIRTVNKYAFIGCVCGLQIKVPPDYKKESLSCPKCGTEHMVPLAELAAITAMVEESEKQRKK
jgi:heat shock protein HtpX